MKRSGVYSLGITISNANFARDLQRKQSLRSIRIISNLARIFKHLVHYGSDSDLAASASQCANDQDKFWDYYHILYTDQDSFMLSHDTSSAVKNLASKIDGLGLQKFDSCMDGGAYKDIAKKDTKLADALGFRDTPTFLIVKSDASSPQTLVGAYPFATFKGLLDKEIGDV